MLYCLIKVFVRFWAISWAKCRFHPHIRENAWKKGENRDSAFPLSQKMRLVFRFGGQFLLKGVAETRLSPFFYAFSRKCGWKRTFTSRNRPKTEPKTLIRQCNKMLFKVRVLMLNFMNLATFHEFAEKRCQFCPKMWLHNIWLFELLKYLTQHRLCINTHTLNNVYQMSF